MRAHWGKRWLQGLFGALILIGANTIGFADQQAGDNPRPGQPSHNYHEEWQGAYPTVSSQQDFRIIRSLVPPDGFIGNLTYDRGSGRMWLISLGPPTNTKGPSTLYEMDPANGNILASSQMPFKGDFGSPVYIDGYIYQGIFHESKLYKIAVADKSKFGRIVKTIPLPTLNDLKLVDESHPLPFIEFGGVTVTPDKQIMIHADDVGELVTIDKETGKILNRVRTLKALGGITATQDSNGNFFVLANSDPRGGYCALSYPPLVSRSPQQKDISWALLDGDTGDVLASIRRQNSRAYASTISLVKYEEDTKTPYGRFTFLATGEEGILTLEWTPGQDSY